jgi:8-amino-7-oxononanoate synthase
MKMYQDWLAAQQQQQLQRQLMTVPEGVLDFSHNDYLNLRHHPALINAACQASRDYGTSVSSSPLISGHTRLVNQLHNTLQTWTNTPYSLVWNSGYQLNQSTLKALGALPKVLFLMDRFCHASLIDGVLASGARWQRFRHNDVVHLTSLLAQHHAQFDCIWVVTESVFSMDGDLAPLTAIANACQQYDAKLYVDEAHACGLYGKTGYSGLVEALGLESLVTLRMGTFSKALGSFGAWLVANNPIWINFLVNAGKGYVYSTGLPPGVVAANVAAIQTVQASIAEREQLKQLILQINPSAYPLHMSDTRTSSPIVPIAMPTNAVALATSHALEQAGFWVKAIRSPTVPTPRLRLTVTASHCVQDLSRLLKQLNHILACTLNEPNQ